MNFIKNIETIISLDKNEKEIISKYIEIKELKKNDFFLIEGKICDSIAFVEEGILIYYKNLDNGNEVTTDFAFKGEWISDNYSRLNKSPSRLNIKAIEDSILYIIKDKDLSDLYTKVPKLEKMGRILMEQAFIKMTQLSIDLQTLSAKERYLKLTMEYPDIIQKMPLYHIANYLGIAPKSLSRIRNNIFHPE